jgi:hypothetical protein
MPDATVAMHSPEPFTAQYTAMQQDTGGSSVENLPKLKTSTRLASALIRAPNSYSGGHEFHPQQRQNRNAN